MIHVSLSQLDPAQRDAFLAYATVLVPGGAGLPSPAEADVAGRGLDRVLAARPDLAAPVAALLAEPGDPTAVLEQARMTAPDQYSAMTLAVSGAYLTAPVVRRALGYPGVAPARQPAYPGEAEYYLEDGILDPVIKRGPIYRHAPSQSPTS